VGYALERGKNSMDKPILELKDIAVLTKDKAILKNINFSVPKGSLTAIIGESGSGKSTLIRLLQVGSNRPQAGFL